MIKVLDDENKATGVYTQIFTRLYGARKSTSTKRKPEQQKLI